MSRQPQRCAYQVSGYGEKSGRWLDYKEKMRTEGPALLKPRITDGEE